MKTEIDYKVFNIIYKINMFIPILILIKYLLGYKKYLYVEIIVYIIMLINVLIFKFSKNKSSKIFKIIVVSFVIYNFTSIYIISFMRLSHYKNLIHTLISIIPPLYYMIFYKR